MLPSPERVTTAVSIKLALHQVPYAQICALLDVTQGVVSQQKQAYLTNGVAWLTLKYRGAKSFLDTAALAEVIAWLQAGQQWSLRTLQQHIEHTDQVVFRSAQSSMVRLIH